MNMSWDAYQYLYFRFLEIIFNFNSHPDDEEFSHQSHGVTVEPENGVWIEPVDGI